MWHATCAAGMAKEKDPRVERLEAQKRAIREQHSWMPFVDWFKRDGKPEKVEGVELEKGDVLAMILAVLSLILPWVLGGAALIALATWLMGRFFAG